VESTPNNGVENMGLYPPCEKIPPWPGLDIGEKSYWLSNFFFLGTIATTARKGEVEVNSFGDRRERWNAKKRKK
jgi:hypothetical protein